MRGTAVALISLLQCAQTVTPAHKPWQWSHEERVAFLYPNTIIVVGVLVCIVWGWSRHRRGLVVIQNLHDMNGGDGEPDARAMARRNSRHHARYNRHY